MFSTPILYYNRKITKRSLKIVQTVEKCSYFVKGDEEYIFWNNDDITNPQYMLMTHKHNHIPIS
ncbi:hypothetical protein MGO_04884 [Candida albicans P76055]|nr:hypothetical protein MGO_04884 [Candida albicans P76055]